MLTKCLKCGTTMEYDQHKCPSCGVSYFDMSCIQFGKDNFVYLKLNISPNEKPFNVIFPMKLRLDNFEINFDRAEAYDRYGNLTSTGSIGSLIKAKISFEGLTADDGVTLFDKSEG